MGSVQAQPALSEECTLSADRSPWLSKHSCSAEPSDAPPGAPVSPGRCAELCWQGAATAAALLASAAAWLWSGLAVGVLEGEVCLLCVEGPLG